MLDSRKKIMDSKINESNLVKLLFKNKMLYVPELTGTTYKSHWQRFSKWCSENGIKYYREITETVVSEYALELIKKSLSGDITPHSIQNKIGGINSIMKVLYESNDQTWVAISPSGLGLRPRKTQRTEAPYALDKSFFYRQMEIAKTRFPMNAVAVVIICREFGFTFAEACLFDAKYDLRVLKKNLKDSNGDISVVRAWDGYHRTHRRKVKILNQYQVDALLFAAAAQGKREQLMPDNISPRNWQEGEFRGMTKIAGHIRHLRSAYACERYKQITGIDAPCVSDQVASNELDYSTRVIIASELGITRESLIAHLGCYRS